MTGRCDTAGFSPIYGALLRSRRIHPAAEERYISSDTEIATSRGCAQMSCVRIESEQTISIYQSLRSIRFEIYSLAFRAHQSADTRNRYPHPFTLKLLGNCNAA